MTVPAEADSGLMSAGVALVAVITVIVVPWAVRLEDRRRRAMNPRIGAAYAVAVAVTSGAGAGRGIGFVAGGAVFDVVLGGPAMVGQPSGRGMQ